MSTIVGIGNVSGAHWKDHSMSSRVADVAKSFLKLTAAAVVLVPLAPFVFILGSVLIIRSIHQLNAIEKTANPTVTPDLGVAKENEAYLTQNGAESMRLKLDLIDRAQRTIELSGSYCGGEIFDRALEKIEKALERGVVVRIISNDDLLTKSNYKKIKELKKKYPEQFFLLETTKKFLFVPTLRTIENHTKLLIVDGAICVTGGTGVQDMLSREGIEAGRSPTRKEKIMGKGARDQDVVVKGPLAKTMRDEFYQLQSKWKRLGAKRHGKVSDRREVPAESVVASNFMDNLRTTGRVRTVDAAFVTGTHEQGAKNEVKRALIQMIDGAKKTITIANMCFNQQEIVDAVCRAAERGVKVTVIANAPHSKAPFSVGILGPSNFVNMTKVVRAGGRAFVFDEDGVLFHKKVTIVDGEKTAIGSFNMSDHCASTEDEDLVIMRSEEMAADAQSVLEQDKKRSTEILLPSVSGIRLAWTRFKAALFSKATTNIFQ